MSYKKDMDAINEFMATAEFRQNIRIAAHNGGTDAIVSDGNNEFLYFVRCASEDVESVKRRISKVKRAKVDQLTENIIGVNVI